ncbi:hypothetical protein A7J05_00905 [Streptomyces alfalfae]|uniref:Uncharacterized protein n=1 Tax=Streptomyces alfalfae TaxID=1642299 RepID=A0ABM6GLE5_9ACTN|nr:hypothetical protein [Streptomyces alfalfae]APY84531.1 hypothetical protein A7J05_00905 [Streptomyces alfalfae]
MRADVCTRVNAVIGVLLLIVLAVGPVQDTVFGVVVLANILLGVVRDVRAGPAPTKSASATSSDPVPGTRSSSTAPCWRRTAWRSTRRS